MFRILMCDPMRPDFSEPAHANIDFKKDFYADLYDLEFIEKKQREQKILAPEDLERDLHGEDPRCMACHYKLDPAGKTHALNGMRLHPFPSPGRLVFHEDNGKEVNVPVSGLKEFVQAAIQTKRYEDCQVDWFWENFIGKDIPLRGKKRTVVTQKFNEMDRKINDFVKYLVMSEDFSALSENDINKRNYHRAMGLLQSCDRCHDFNRDIGFVDMPNISYNFPIGGTIEKHQKWMGKIEKRMNLPNSDEDQMPANKPVWDAKDIEFLKSWIKDGARDEDGNKTYE